MNVAHFRDVDNADLFVFVSEIVSIKRVTTHNYDFPICQLATHSGASMVRGHPEDYLSQLAIIIDCTPTEENPNGETRS